MKHKFSKGGLISTIILCILVVILLPIFIINLTLIIKGNINRDVPPDVFGIAPLAVTTGSMAGSNADSFDEGSLIFVKLLDEGEKNSLKEGDIVTFYIADEEIFVTHRIIEVLYAEDQTISSVITRGDANYSDDGIIAIADIVGKCVGSVGGLGAFALFLQTPAGIIVFVGIPIIAFIAYDALSIMLYNRKVKAQDNADKLIRDKDEEIARLRAIVGERQSQSDDSKPEEIEKVEKSDN